MSDPASKLLSSAEEGALFYQTANRLPVVSHAEGVFIWDRDGKRYLDGCSGAITCNLGHGHAAIRAAMAAQLDKIAFSYRTQFENQPAIDLAERIVRLTQDDLQKVFFVGSGSEAVEACMKLARQYFVAVGASRRNRFVSLRPSYHGGTLGALGLTGYQPLEAPYVDITTASVKVPGPDFYRMAERDENTHVERVLEETQRRVAAVGGETIIAVVLEPVGGASTGARMLNQKYLDGIRKLCDHWGCLLILDEVLSGVGRTGRWFAYQHWNAVPDIMALAKGLGAGYYPVGAAVAKRNIVEPVLRSGGFMHGHTYAGNPLACATALAVVQVIERERLLAHVAERGTQLRLGLEALQARYPMIGHVRGVGLLQAIELVGDPDTKVPFPAEWSLFNQLTEIARTRGLLIYPRRSLDGVAGDHFLITPPLTITRDEVDLLLELLDRALSDLRQTVSTDGLRRAGVS